MTCSTHHPEKSLFHVENGAMGGINGTSDALCGSRSHDHIRVDCYELFYTTLGAIYDSFKLHNYGEMIAFPPLEKKTDF